MNMDVTQYEDIESQTKQIRSYLEAGNSITGLEAIRMFGCLRLSARIYDLRDKGMDIRTTIETKKKRNGKFRRYARYWLHKNPD